LISGAGFYGVPAASIGGQALTAVRKLTTTTLKGDVPAGLPAGNHDVKVCNPDGQCGVLPGGYRVLGTGPNVTSVLPGMGYDDAPNPLVVHGYNFAAGVTLQIGGTSLTEINRRSPTEVRAVAPANLPVGAQDVRACNPDNQCDTLEDGYVVLTHAGDDLSVNADDIWTLPITIRQGDLVQLGVNVHRDGGMAPLEPAVAFYRGDPANGGTEIGSTRLPPMDPGAGVVESAAISWDTSGISGAAPIYVVVDPRHVISETTRANNAASRLVTVLPAAPDIIPPHVTALQVNHGAPSTADPRVTVTLSAADNTGGSGVESMYLVEREFSSAARTWVPVQRTGWVPFQPTYAMTLTGEGGMRYIEVRVADGAGNISDGVKTSINYLPPVSLIWALQAQIYRQHLDVGQQISVTLATLSGDADLLVWKPNGGLAGVSINGGLMPDQVSFTATQAGDYQIEVWGWISHLASTYNLQIATLPNGSTVWPTMGPARSAPQDDGKTINAEPVIPTGAEPAGNTAIPPAPIRGAEPSKVYLPVTMNGYAVPLHLDYRAYLPVTVNNPVVAPPAPDSYQVYLPVTIN
jgi:hypothetical protein